MEPLWFIKSCSYVLSSWPWSLTYSSSSSVIASLGIPWSYRLNLWWLADCYSDHAWVQLLLTRRVSLRMLLSLDYFYQVWVLIITANQSRSLEPFVCCLWLYMQELLISTSAWQIILQRKLGIALVICCFHGHGGVTKDSGESDCDI